MNIRFIKEYRALLDDGCCRTYQVGQTWSVNITLAQWLIDNGFAEKVDDTKGGWRPKIDDTYYYVRDTMSMFMRDEVGRESWDDDDEDNEYRYSIGNVFKTIESARRFIDYLKAVETVRHDEGFMKYDKIQGEVWELRRAYLDSEEFFTARKIECGGLHHLGAFYFDTEEHAIASSEKHHSEWETILNYDWSRE